MKHNYDGDPMFRFFCFFSARCSEFCTVSLCLLECLVSRCFVCWNVTSLCEMSWNCRNTSEICTMCSVAHRIMNFLSKLKQHPYAAMSWLHKNVQVCTMRSKAQLISVYKALLFMSHILKYLMHNGLLPL